MWTNGQTKRNKRFQYGKWRLHTSLTPLYGSVMASQPLTAFVGFPHFHWNCETDRCLPACIHSLTLPFMYSFLFLAPSALLSSPQIIFHYFVSHSPSVGKGRYSKAYTLYREAQYCCQKHFYWQIVTLVSQMKDAQTAFFVSLAQFLYFIFIFDIRYCMCLAYTSWPKVRGRPFYLCNSGIEHLGVKCGL